jgi:2-oxoglutarate/2-oxoacid ferredoxin oxidoreductase subunit alpha
MPDDISFNDFVLKFANVNGSGSASANLLCARALFRMGIMVTPKNIFPSNIQGMPTWYEIRVSEAGYQARRNGIDIMVAMNPQTYDRDIGELVPGGAFIYDSSWPRKFSRNDVEIIGIPLAKICAENWSDPRQRQLLKNIMYLGALARLIEIDREIVEQLISEQFSKKPKLVAANIKAFQVGYTYASKNFARRLPVRCRKSRRARGKIMITGNEAAALGAIYAGATVAAWYPITPSTSLAEAFERHARSLRRDAQGRTRAAVIQAEDELAAIGIAVGAGWNGARSFTATSGPGISLMGEFIGLAYFAEVPVVIFDIQRGGPSTGMPTRTQQSDIIACAYASHGDTGHVLLFPADPAECFTMSADAFDLAERLQTPVFVMSDLDIGMNDWIVDPLTWDDARKPDRGKVLGPRELEETVSFRRYADVDGDGIPYRTIPGRHASKGAYFTRGSSHNEAAGYTEDGTVHAAMLARLKRKFETAAQLVPEPAITMRSQKSRLGVIAFGSTDAPLQEALADLARHGHGLNYMRLRAFPFQQKVAEFIEKHDFLFVIEQNRDGQMRHLLISELEVPASKLLSITSLDGFPVTAEFIEREILEALAAQPRVKRASATPITAA